MSSPAQFRTAFAQARTRSDAVFSLIKPETFYTRPIPERHRVIFYLGHLEAFDWNQICRWTLDQPSFHPEFDRLFEAGIDPPVGELPQDQPSDWPSIQEVQHYNARVREKIDGVLQEAPEEILHVALEHRLMHVETTAYILHHIPREGKVVPKYSPGVPTSPSLPTVPYMVEIPAGEATLGRDRQEGFGWDNEFAKQVEHVPGFAISKYKITNGQYLKFVEEGGSPPHFWVHREGNWFLRTTFGQVPLPEEWPVYVSQCEAQAYATWAGMALPTEAQFHRAAFGTRKGEERIFPWGNKPPKGANGNFDFTQWDPVSVAVTPLGDSDFGVSQMVGNGWEWTSTLFRPFEGFQPISTYPMYSARFFDDDHVVVKGGSPQTAARFLRRSFRNWFRKNYPYAFAGFRCVQS